MNNLTYLVSHTMRKYYYPHFTSAQTKTQTHDSYVPELRFKPRSDSRTPAPLAAAFTRITQGAQQNADRCPHQPPVTPSFCFCQSGVQQEDLHFLTSSLEVLLLIREPHLENHCSRPPKTEKGLSGAHSRPKEREQGLLRLHLFQAKAQLLKKGSC